MNWWFKLDPWFALRFYIRDLCHPKSPLSSTTLVHRAFFCPSYPTEKVVEFERFMPDYESLMWPIGMMHSFIKVKNVLMNILGWTQGRQRLLVVAGSEDKLMSVKQMRKMASQYRQALMNLIQKRLITEKKDVEAEEADEVESAANGVRFEIVNGSGHHIQNDLQWEVAADRILEFLNQL